MVDEERARAFAEAIDQVLRGLDQPAANWQENYPLFTGTLLLREIFLGSIIWR